MIRANAEELVTVVGGSLDELTKRFYTRNFALGGVKIGGALPEPPRVAVGMRPGPRPADWRFVVRAWTPRDMHAARVLVARARIPEAEIDARITGRVSAGQGLRARDLRRRLRPLLPGCSIGHPMVTAGTAGAFVHDAEGIVYLLSNNHVMANANRANIGDVILQPGRADRAFSTVADIIGTLQSFVPLQLANNIVDAAISSLEATPLPVSPAIPGIGRIVGALRRPNDVRVRKLGRTTGLTSGRISAISLRSQAIQFGRTTLRFDGVIEVESDTPGRSFSEGGDSGALVVDAGNHAVGLLFAGGKHATYLNPIDEVLDAFDVDLMT